MACLHGIVGHTNPLTLCFHAISFSLITLVFLIWGMDLASLSTLNAQRITNDVGFILCQLAGNLPVTQLELDSNWQKSFSPTEYVEWFLFQNSKYIAKNKTTLIYWMYSYFWRPVILLVGNISYFHQNQRIVSSCCFTTICHGNRVIATVYIHNVPDELKKCIFLLSSINSKNKF